MEPEKPNENPNNVSVAEVAVQQKEDDSKSTNQTKRSDKTKNVPALDKNKKSQIKRKHPPTSEMVLDSIKAMKKRYGASLLDISKYIEENYDVDIKKLKPHLNTFLINSVEKEILDQVSGVGSTVKYKIKKKEIVRKEKRNLPENSIKKDPKKSKSTDQNNRLDKTKNIVALDKSKKDQVKRKPPAHLPTSEMILDAIETLEMAEGTSLQDITTYVEESYGVDTKITKIHFNRLLKDGVEKGILDQVSGVGASRRFKIMKKEAAKKEKRSLPEEIKHVYM